MDPVSLTLGIVSLYSTCRDCYDFFTTLRKAETESEVYLRELQIQQSILKAWGFHWQIYDESGGEPGQLDRKPPDRKRLQTYLMSNRFKAEGVLDTLCALADTLSNQVKLTKRYGIQLQPAKTSPGTSQSYNNVTLAIHNTKIEDVKPVVSEVKHRLSLLHKFKWEMNDKDCFQQLLNVLKSHGESLYRLCPENAFEAMNIYWMVECLAKQESPAGLKSTSKLATEQAAENGMSSMRACYQLLASAAILKASVNENRGGEQTDSNALATIDEVQGVMRYLGKGLALFEGQVVYVEMRDYRGAPLEPTPSQKKRIKRRQDRERIMASFEDNGDRHRLSHADFTKLYGTGNEVDDDDKPIEIVRSADPRLRALIVNFFKTFKGSSMRDSVSGLDITGMIDHTAGEYKGHCSILYRLPSTIGIQNRERPAENLKLRAPLTLRSLLGNAFRKGVRSVLSVRFELARKLVRAVCLLHSSGWLHKNIRAESVMFFPEHVSALHEDRYEIDIEIDVSKPILMGYIFSRPNDIIQKLPPPTDSRKDDPPLTEEETRRSHTQVYEETETPRVRSIHGYDTLEPKAEPEDKKQPNISGLKLDYYQHPAKHANPQRLHRHAYDVYSLGILLLEVGLWKQLRISDDSNDPDNEDGEDHYERRRRICRRNVEDLRWTCGDTYADVVLSCIMIECGDDEAGLASERELCARLVADLEGCRA
jgi:serine/threonine protein kinase